MTKVKCLSCNDIIESDGNGKWVKCSCGKIYIDETGYYCRIGGDTSDWEIIKEPTKEKWCYKCGNTYPYTEEYWYWSSSKHKRLKTICKKCSNYESMISQRIRRARKKDLKEGKI